MLRVHDRRTLQWIAATAGAAVAAAVVFFAFGPSAASNAREAPPAARAAPAAAEPIAPAPDATSERAALGDDAADDTDVLPEPTPAVDAQEAAFFGRVIDATARTPVAGAEITTTNGARWLDRLPHAHSDLPQARTDLRGRFELRPTRNGEIAWIRAAGFGPACFAIDDAHATEERAFEIVLAPAARIDARVHDLAAAPIADARVRVWTQANKLARPEGSYTRDADPEWIAATDWQGAAALVDLPADVTLAIEVEPLGADKPTRFQDLVLARGEVRVCELKLGVGSLVTGTLLSHDGRALARQEVWLTNSIELNWKQRASCFFGERDGSNAFARVSTDEQGRFEIAGVPRGRWWIGPALRLAGVRYVSGNSPRGIIVAEEKTGYLDPLTPCAVATMIEVDGVRSLDLTLRVQCGLYITGRVLDPEGHPGPGGVRAHGVEVGGPLDANKNADGTFAVGPLPLGRFVLWAEGSGDIADSEQVTVEAGARDVELRLRASCKFIGVLTGVDTSESEYHAFAVNEVGIALCPLHDDGSFELGGMAPGKYDLVAAGLNGWFGAVRGALFESSERDQPLEIPMHPGARVRVHYTGPASEARVKIYDGDGLAAFDIVSAGASTLCTVPAGRLRVELRVDEAALQRRELDIAAGELADVDFKLE